MLRWGYLDYKLTFQKVSRAKEDILVLVNNSLLISLGFVIPSLFQELHHLLGVVDEYHCPLTPCVGAVSQYDA